jgi:hypothetical protein
MALIQAKNTKTLKFSSLLKEYLLIVLMEVSKSDRIAITTTKTSRFYGFMEVSKNAFTSTHEKLQSRSLWTRTWNLLKVRSLPHP